MNLDSARARIWLIVRGRWSDAGSKSSCLQGLPLRIAAALASSDAILPSQVCPQRLIRRSLEFIVPNVSTPPLRCTSCCYRALPSYTRCHGLWYCSYTCSHGPFPRFSLSSRVKRHQTFANTTTSRYIPLTTFVGKPITDNLPSSNVDIACTQRRHDEAVDNK